MISYILYQEKDGKKEKLMKCEDFNEVINYLSNEKANTKTIIQPVRQVVVNSLARDKEFEKLKKLDPDLKFSQLEQRELLAALKTKLMANVNEYINGTNAEVSNLADTIELCAALAIVNHNVMPDKLEEARKEITKFKGRYTMGYYVHSIEEEVK